MRYLKDLVVFIVICFLSSCNTKQSLFGMYGAINKGGKSVPYSYGLKLNNDSTFNFTYSSGWIYRVSNGTWSMDSKRNNLFLYSNINNIKNTPINVSESSNININSKEFYFVSPTKNSTLWSVVINGYSYPIKSNKIIFPGGIKMDSFYLIGYDDFTHIRPNPIQDTVRTEVYHIRNINNNIIKVNFPNFVDYNIFYYEPIINRFRIKGKYIIWKKDIVKLRKIH